MRGSKLLKEGLQVLTRVAGYHVLALINLEIIFHVLKEHIYFTVQSFAELVDDQKQIEATEVKEEHLNFKLIRQFMLNLRCPQPRKQLVM